MAKAKPRVSVIERRLRNPFGTPSTEIELTVPGMVPRWFNAAIITDKIWRAKQGGWEPVTPEMLKDKDQVGGFQVSAEGYVCRGEKQQELLMYMARADRDAIQQAKTQHNVRAMKMGRQRDEIVNAVANQFGDRAGDFVNGTTKMVGNVTDQYERIHRDDNVVE